MVLGTVVCGVLAVVGCSTTEDGNAQPSTTDTAVATAALWDPCSEIPEATLTGLGLNPGSKRSGILGAEEPGWKICRWTDAEYPSNYSTAVYSTTHTIDEVRTKPGNTNFEDIVIAGRTGVQYTDSSHAADEYCVVAFETATGFAQIDMINTSSKSKQVAPCDRLQTVAEAVVPLMPK
ncbi:DUF3558 domain-containing protein [Nocardia sp. NPDC059177]|uniref:DUF3558 domain-containing protein n=1 Tax=Nocardia sp. NPDC059177 TaxID=3346759 RepID=UPI0036CFEA8E